MHPNCLAFGLTGDPPNSRRSSPRRMQTRRTFPSFAAKTFPYRVVVVFSTFTSGASVYLHCYATSSLCPLLSIFTPCPCSPRPMSGADYYYFDQAFLDSCHSGTLLDLPHHHCNQVWVPWLSQGKRRTKTLQNWNGAPGPSLPFSFTLVLTHHVVGSSRLHS